MIKETETINYYNTNAAAFAANTVDVDFSEVQNRFMELLPPKAGILDFGCGSGRDTRCFLEHGFAVDAIDGSEELCRMASLHTGIPVKHMYFEELDAEEVYDGIWACASILHVQKTELADIFHRMTKALKPGGILYTSFKCSEFEGERNGRYFTDFTPEKFRAFLADLPELKMEVYWITGDVREGRDDEKWLNLILRRTT